MLRALPQASQRGHDSTNPKCYGARLELCTRNVEVHMPSKLPLDGGIDLIESSSFVSERRLATNVKML